MKVIFLCDNEKKFRAVFPPAVIERLRAHAVLDERLYTKADVLKDPDRFGETEAIFSTWGMPVFTEEEIRRCFPRLSCLFYAAGTVQKFARPFLACGVRVFSAWAANGVPVAEYTVAQIILANKGFYSHTRLMKEERYKEAKAHTAIYPGSYGARVGLIGCGMIGSMVAERLKAYKLSVLAFDPFLKPERAEALGVRLCGLDEIFSTCQTVSNHLANNEATQGILQYEHFSSMPPYATFLNTGRGAQVVENDLVRALTERPDLTAVLDVTYPEPPVSGHPFYTLRNCFLTPHIAGSLGDEVVRMAEYMLDEYLRCIGGGGCLYEVTPEMLLTMA